MLLERANTFDIGRISPESDSETLPSDVVMSAANYQGASAYL